MRFLNEHISYFFIAFLSGVFLSGVAVHDIGIIGALVLVGGAMLIVGLVRPRSVFVVSAVMLLCAAFGVFRFATWSDTALHPEIVRAVGSEVHMTGIIVEEPDVREQKVNLTVLVKTIGDGAIPVNTRILVSTDIYPSYKYGEVIELKGTLQYPKAFESENGRVFAYDRYLATKEIRLVAYRPVITRTGNIEGNVVKKSLLAIKGDFKERIGAVLPDPAGALAGGILLGDKRSLGETLTEDFRKSGIVHIVVLSGYNMTIVAEWLRVIFLFTGFWGSISIAAFGVVLFGIMAGGSATVVRAMLMALLVLLARLLGRTYDMSRALLFAAVLMVLHAPGILLYDPSFQLSFLAASGLLLFVPILSTRITMFRRWPKFEEIILSTLATQLFVTPLLIYGSGGISLVGLFANILVLPLIPAAMLLSFIAGLSAYIATAFGIVVALPAYVSLEYIITVGTYFARIPFGYVALPPISGAVVCLFYILLFVLCMRSYQRGIISPQKAPR